MKILLIVLLIGFSIRVIGQDIILQGKYFDNQVELNIDSDLAYTKSSTYNKINKNNYSFGQLKKISKRKYQLLSQLPDSLNIQVNFSYSETNQIEINFKEVPWEQNEILNNLILFEADNIITPIMKGDSVVFEIPMDSLKLPSIIYFQYGNTFVVTKRIELPVEMLPSIVSVSVQDYNSELNNYVRPNILNPNILNDYRIKIKSENEILLYVKGAKRRGRNLTKSN